MPDADGENLHHKNFKGDCHVWFFMCYIHTFENNQYVARNAKATHCHKMDFEPQELGKNIMLDQVNAQLDTHVQKNVWLSHKNKNVKVKDALYVCTYV